MDSTVVLIILIGILIIITLYVIIKMNRFMRTIMGEEKLNKENLDNILNIKEGIQNNLLEKNSQNITKLIEINSEIDIEKASQFAINTLFSIFSTIEDYNFENISYYSQLIYLKLNNIIVKQKDLQQVESFQDVSIASIYLTDVEDSKGYTSLVFEINISMKHYIQKNNEIIFGDIHNVISDRYSIAIVFINDVSKMDYETKRTIIHGVKCPNCGENIREIKDTTCMVCDNDNSKLIENRFIAIDFNRG